MNPVRGAVVSCTVAAALALGVQAFGFAYPGAVPTIVRTAAIVLLCAAFGFAGDGAFRLDSILRASSPAWSWIVRIAFLALIALLSFDGAGLGQPLFAPGRLAPPRGLILVVFAYAGSLSILLAILLEAAARATRGVRRLRTRLVWLALFAAMASLAMYFFFSFVIRGGPGNPSVLAWTLQLTLTGAVLIGIAQVLARPMASTLEQLSSAVREVSRGNLDAKIPDDGRDELADLAHALKLMIADLRRFVTPAVLFALRRQQETQVQSERREASILFFDVRGFTALSEIVAAEEVMRMIDFLFERMIEVVGAKDGYINRFTGDGMMIVFGAPMDRADHAQAAVDCAVTMQSLMTTLNEASKFGPGRRLEIGIGISSGQVVAGALGSAAREEYTVFGDCVNVANRLCSSAGGGEILIGAATAAATTVARESMPPLMVKGKSFALEVFRVAA